MGTGKQSKSATELAGIALAEIQRRKIERIYNVTISSRPYGGSNGTWYLIINQIGLHDDDPVRKDMLDQESPSEKQWRYSLLEVERYLYDNFELRDSKIKPAIELQDSKIKPPVQMTFDRATVRKIVEDHTRETFRLRGFGMRAKNMKQID